MYMPHLQLIIRADVLSILHQQHQSAGIKIGITAELTSGMTFMELYARSILAFQKYARKMTGDATLELPLVSWKFRPLFIWKTALGLLLGQGVASLKGFLIMYNSLFSKTKKSGKTFQPDFSYGVRVSVFDGFLEGILVAWHSWCPHRPNEIKGWGTYTDYIRGRIFSGTSTWALHLFRSSWNIDPVILLMVQKSG